MMELQVRSATQCSSMTPKRLAYLKQCEQERKLWIAQNRTLSELTLTGEHLNDKGKWVIDWVCSCGRSGCSKKSDLVRAMKLRGWVGCYNCSQKRKMSKIATTDSWKEHQQKMVKAASNSVSEKAKERPYRHLRFVCTGAKDRCTNKNSRSYANYGARGIKFKFDSPMDMAKWVYENLGDRPSKYHSIDRIDNNRHYEPGNLRWATLVEQANNKRAYRVGAIGERIRNLLVKRPDYCYESIRNLIKQGFTDEEIINRRKGEHSS